MTIILLPKLLLHRGNLDSEATNKHDGYTTVVIGVKSSSSQTSTEE
jgi:hypothetical protein